MNTIKNISGSVALIAFVLALPVAAEEQISTKLNEQTGFQPVATKSAMPIRSSDAPSSRKVIEATLPTAPSKEPTSSADSMPYVTYDGAANSPQ